MIAIRTRGDPPGRPVALCSHFHSVGNTVTFLFACHTLENHTINTSVAHRSLLE